MDTEPRAPADLLDLLHQIDAGQVQATAAERATIAGCLTLLETSPSPELFTKRVPFLYSQAMTSTETLRVIGYVRASTNKQDISPEVQEAALMAEAARKGWALDIRREKAASASSLKNRPVLANALEELKAGKRYDALAVSKLDRLSRNVHDFAGMLQTAGKEGWALICLDLNIDTSTITGAAMAQVSVVFAELERKKIAERTRDGMQEIKRSTGKHMGRKSALPAETVERILSDRAAGKPLSHIAAALNAEGVKTAAGGKWYASTIKAIAESETVKQMQQA